MIHRCEACSRNAGPRYFSWSKCGEEGIGVTLCEACAASLDAMSRERAILTLQRRQFGVLDLGGSDRMGFSAAVVRIWPCGQLRVAFTTFRPTRERAIKSAETYRAKLEGGWS